MYPSKESIKSQLIDVDSQIPEIDKKTFNFDGWINKLNDIDKKVKAGTLSWQDYYNGLDDNLRWIAKWGQETEGQVRTQRDLIKANQQARSTALDQNEAIKAQTLSARAGKAAMQALAAAGNMLASWGISQAIQLFYSCVTASDRLQESARDLAGQFSSTQSDLASYKAKIESLYETIRDGSSSYEDTCKARQELLSIQDEMIEKFGSEATAVKLVTDAINGQSGALDSLSRQKWSETLDKFSHDSSRSWTEKLGDTLANVWSGSSNNYQRMLSEMEDTTVSFNVTPRLNDDSYAKFTKVLEQDFGVGIQAGIGSSLTGYKAYNTITLTGDLDDIYSRLQNIKTLAENMGLDDSYINALSQQAEKIKSRLDSYQEIYSQHVLYEKVFQNDSYEESFQNINDAYQNYRETFVSGDTKAIESAKQAFVEIVQAATEGVTDHSVTDFFAKMYPDLQEEVNGWLFEVHFKAAVDDDTDPLEDDLRSALQKFYSPDEILHFHATSATPDTQITAYAVLKQTADDYNMTLEQLLAKTQQLGLIRSTVDVDFNRSLRTLSDNHGITDRTQYAWLTEQTAGFTDEQKKLWLETTRGAENAAQAVAKYQARLAQPPQTAPSSSWSDGLTSSADSLDKFRSSVKSASDAYATLLAGDYSSAELLDSIRTISQTVSDLKGSIDWDAIFSSDHPLQSIQEEIASLSAAYADSILADAEIGTDSGLGQMLSNIVQEAYESQAALSALNTQLNSLQSAYGSLTEIVAAYNETGSVTFDQLQTLLAMEPQYLSCLLNEHGLLQLNQQAFLALANQRLNDAESQAIQQAITELHEIILQDEQTAVAENAETFGEAVNNISAYNETLADTIAETSVSAATIRDLNAAIHDRKTDGVSDLQIDTILNNLNTKLQLISSTKKSLDKNLGTIMGSPSSAPETAPEPTEPVEPVEKAPLKEAETDWKALLEKETALLERQLEAGVIRFREYTDKRRAILDQYYRDGKIKAADYYAALEDMYKYQLSNYDKVINAVTGQLDARIKLLEKQKEAVEDSWQVKIDALQEEIDALNKANEARKAQIDLEKAQYEAERARNQRTKKIYNGTEYLYEADRQAIRDAQDNLADQEFQLHLSRLEFQLESLKEELEHATESIDQQIDALQSYRDKWNEISDEYEEQQNKLIAAEILGADWEKQVLDGRLNVLNAFKDQYIRIQQTMAAAAQAAASEQLKAGQEAAKNAASDSEHKKDDTASETAKPGNTSSKTTSKASPKTEPPKINKGSAAKTGTGILRGEAGRNFQVTAYSTGTENARKGLNLVGEDGIETFIGNDGSAALVTAPSLIPMEGGETVKNKQDTRELFRNLANGNSLSPGETDSMTPRTAADLFQEELKQLFPGFYNLVPQAQLLSPVPGRDAVNRLPEAVPLVQNVSLTLPNVTNNSGYERLVRELKQMQIDAVQEAHRR